MQLHVKHIDLKNPAIPSNLLVSASTIFFYSQFIFFSLHCSMGNSLNILSAIAIPRYIGNIVYCLTFIHFYHRFSLYYEILKVEETSEWSEMKVNFQWLRKYIDEKNYFYYDALSRETHRPRKLRISFVLLVS